MPVGDKFAFLQTEASSAAVAVGTAPVTVTFSTGAQPAPAVRVVNCGTSTVFIALISTLRTSSASILTGMPILPVATGAAAVQIFRTGGETKLAAICDAATLTGIIRVTAGEGVRA